MASNNVKHVEHGYGYQDGTHNINPTTPSPPAQGDGNLNYQMTSSQPSPALLNAINSAALTQQSQGNDNIRSQMTSSQPSSVPLKVMNSAALTPSVQWNAQLGHQITSSHPPPGLYHFPNFVRTTAPVPVTTHISNQMTSRHPSPHFPKMITINSVALSPPARDHEMTSSLLPLSFYNIQSDVRSPAPKCNTGLSKEGRQRLNNWFESNRHHPYANKKVTEMLARTCNITALQVRKWLTNKRMRNKQPKSQTAPNREPGKSL